MGEDIVITFETLYDLLRREKNKEELQKLEQTYFQDVIAYLQEKKEVLATKIDVDDLFIAGEKEKIETEIKNIKKIIAELYERREKKILDIALNKSKTASHIINTSTLLPEEKQLFDTIVSTLNVSRQSILSPLLRAQEPSMNLIPDTSATPLSAGKQEMHSTSENPNSIDISDKNIDEPPTTINKSGDDAQEDEIKKIPAGVMETKVEPKETTEGNASEEQDNSLTLKITHSIPQFLGENLQTYGPYQEGDIARLPQRIAKIIVDKERGIIQEEALLKQESKLAPNHSH